MANKKKPTKDPAAVSLGHLGGKVGGPARARVLSALRRHQIAVEGGLAAAEQHDKKHHRAK